MNLSNQKDQVNLKIYDVTTWETDNSSTPIVKLYCMPI